MLRSLQGRRIWIISGLQGNNRRQRITDKLKEAGADEVRWVAGEKAKNAAFVPNDVVVFHTGVNGHSSQGVAKERARQVGAAFIFDYALKPETILAGGRDDRAFPGVERVPGANEHLDTAEHPVAATRPPEPASAQEIEAAASEEKKRGDGVWKLADPAILAAVKAKPDITLTELEKQFDITAGTIKRRLEVHGVELQSGRKKRKAPSGETGADLAYIFELLVEIDAKLEKLLERQEGR